MARPSKPLSERFWQKVDEKEIDECWLWTGTKNRSGYGMAFAGQGKRVIRAHRVAWELINGPIPNGLCVCHKCDVRACCNPNHLFLGTRQENSMDRDRKGRTHKGEQVGHAKLTVKLAAKIRAVVAAGLSQRKTAIAFNVSAQTVCNVVNLKIWVKERTEGNDSTRKIS